MSLKSSSSSSLLSIGRIIDNAWDTYKSRFPQLLAVSGWLLLPTLVSVVSFALYPSASDLLAQKSLGPVEQAAIAIWIANALLLTPVTGLLTFIALVRVLKREDEGSKPLAHHPFSKLSRSVFWSVMLAQFLTALVLLASWLLVLPGSLLVVLGGLTLSGVVSMIGGLLLIVGVAASLLLTFRWLVLYAYAPFAVLFDGRRGRKALTRSRELIRGRWWPAAIRMFLPKLVFFLAAFAIQALAAFLLDILLSTVAGLNSDLYVRLSGIFSTLFVGLAAIIFNPLFLSADVIVYENLRDTKTNP